MMKVLTRWATPVYKFLQNNHGNVARFSTGILVNNSKVDHERISSFHSMKKSRRVLEYFSHQYMCHHNMEPIDIMRYIDHLTFIETLAYLVDDENEQVTNNSHKTLTYDFSSVDTINDDEFKYNINKNAAFSTLYRYLKQQNFYDNYTHQQLYNGLLYYKIEQYLCDAIDHSDTSKKNLSKYLIDKCNSLRSFDFRLLNLALYKLTEKPYDDEILDFMVYVEISFETIDDLLTYKEDVSQGTYNIYRMYVNLYNNEAKAHMEKYCCDIEESLTQRFNKLLIRNPNLPKLHQHSRTFTLVHRQVSPNKYIISRKWNIPEAILDEKSWRKHSVNS